MSQLTNLAFFHARPGQAEALGAALAALAEPTRAEPGCLNYDIHQSVDDPGDWVVYENWRSREGLEAHLQAPQVQAFAKTAPRLLASDIEQRGYAMFSTRASRPA